MRKILFALLVIILLSGFIAGAEGLQPLTLDSGRIEFTHPIFVTSGPGNWHKDIRAVDINPEIPQNRVEEIIVQAVKFIDLDETPDIVFKIDGSYYLVDGYQHGDGCSQSVWYNTLEIHNEKTLR